MKICYFRLESQFKDYLLLRCASDVYGGQYVPWQAMELRVHLCGVEYLQFLFGLWDAIQAKRLSPQSLFSLAMKEQF